ncbi:proton channel OtopLc-like isoform X4 [Ornithodoros turicata]|uniref:proton channel OtopLc-like isoform X4 n=1 Tax=Ornithodoros turicata TaxID=34597 RepID=UPI00313926B7
MTVARSNADDEDGTDRQRRGETRRARQIHPMECLRRGQTRRGAGIETKVPNVIAIVSFDRKPLFLQALLESYAEQHLWRLHLHYGRHLLCGRSCPGQFSCLRGNRYTFPWYVSNKWVTRLQIFSILVAAAGVLWLAILHVDVLWHKHSASRRVRPSQSGLYAHSTASVFRMQAKKTSAPRLWFLIGRHSGSFYLKGGMVVFCFCHLVNEGLILQDTVNNMRIEGQTVRDTLKIAFHVLRPIYSFYQLFIAFKYSNIVINHAFTASRFGMMHLIGTCLYFWFSSIVQEYHHSTHGDYKHGNRTILDFTSVTLYLQPFTIEYQIILAGVWYIVWQNIGTDPPGQTRRQSEGDMWYESYTLLTSHVVTVIQVVLQTLFLSDGLRRCSNSRRQKFTKPGRETVTFLIVCNIAIWVTNTFQTEKPHLNNYMRMCFGESAWVMVKHSTLPLMLFYRFHSSVCLADIWKSAYESDIAL